MIDELVVYVFAFQDMTLVLNSAWYFTYDDVINW